jgi:hypothetical protein
MKSPLFLNPPPLLWLVGDCGSSFSLVDGFEKLVSLGSMESALVRARFFFVRTPVTFPTLDSSYTQDILKLLQRSHPLLSPEQRT